jgi:hypothetical protein
MRGLKLGRSIRRVSIIKADGSGEIVLHKGKKSKKKKQNKELKPMERAVRHMADANLASAKSFSNSHRKSNRKKKNGWLRDISKNIMRANRKGNKKL